MLNVGARRSADKLFNLHRSFGALIWLSPVCVCCGALYAPPPPIVAPMPAWQKRIAEVTHILLYLLLFAVPLVGWAGTSAFGARIAVFGLFELPMILEKNKEIADILLPLHAALALSLCGLLVMHIGAALHHHFFRKDDTLRRMLPRL